eukprot:Opistho-1_new@85596
MGVERTFVPISDGDVGDAGGPLRIALASWNVNYARPSEADAREWLGVGKHAAADVYAVGLQEFDGSVRSFVHPDGTLQAEWVAAIEKAIASFGGDHVLLAEVRLAGMLFVVYATGRVAGEARNVSASYVGCGLRVMPYYQLGNKGGLAVRFEYRGKSVCILSCHLAAHSHYCQRRNRDFHRIVRRLRLGESPLFAEARPVLDHDCVFVMGDLNYRICLPGEEARRLAHAGDLDGLAACDQLRLQQQYGRSFVGFDEAPLSFPPTYKYDVGSPAFDSSDKARGPAWCDRILWKATGARVRPLAYDSRPSVIASDHRPVIGVYEVHLDATESPHSSPASSPRSNGKGVPLTQSNGHIGTSPHVRPRALPVRTALAAVDALMRALVVSSALVALFLGTPRPAEPLPSSPVRVTGVLGAGGGVPWAGRQPGTLWALLRGLLSTEGMGHRRLFPRTAADLSANRLLALMFLAAPLLFEAIVGVAYGLSYWVRVVVSLIVLAPATRGATLALVPVWVLLTWPAVAAVALICVRDSLRARRSLAAAVYPSLGMHRA